jgi:hypothetical protein
MGTQSSTPPYEGVSGDLDWARPGAALGWRRNGVLEIVFPFPDAETLCQLPSGTGSPA